jgi:hypothetical protein
MEVRRKNRDQLRAKGKIAVGAVKWQANCVPVIPIFLFLFFSYIRLSR